MQINWLGLFFFFFCLSIFKCGGFSVRLYFQIRFIRQKPRFRWEIERQRNFSSFLSAISYRYKTEEEEVEKRRSTQTKLPAKIDVICYFGLFLVAGRINPFDQFNVIISDFVSIVTRPFFSANFSLLELCGRIFFFFIYFELKRFATS